MQETQFELWVPVNHASQLQHWMAATDTLDHVILTAAALESVLEGMLPNTMGPATCKRLHNSQSCLCCLGSQEVCTFTHAHTLACDCQKQPVQVNVSDLKQVYKPIS